MRARPSYRRRPAGQAASRRQPGGPGHSGQAACPHRPADRGHAGQAAVELVALLPLLIAALAALWQLAVAGHAAWAVASAATAAARAHAVGLDPRAAALGHLPPALERGLRVTPLSGGAVRVAVRIPKVLVPLGDVTATAQFEPQR